MPYDQSTQDMPQKKSIMDMMDSGETGKDESTSQDEGEGDGKQMTSQLLDAWDMLDDSQKKELLDHAEQLCYTEPGQEDKKPAVAVVVKGK